MRAASSMTGHGVSSRSSHSWRDGPDDVFGEVVDPFLDLQLVFAEIERELGHVFPLVQAPPRTPSQVGTCFGSVTLGPLGSGGLDLPLVTQR